MFLGAGQRALFGVPALFIDSNGCDKQVGDNMEECMEHINSNEYSLGGCV